LRVLIIHPHIFAGGAEKVLLNMAYELEKRSCYVDIATLTLDLSKLPPHLHKLRFMTPECRPTLPDKGSLKATAKSTYLENLLLIDQIRGRVDDYDLFNPHNFPAYWAVGLTKGCRQVVWHCNEVLGPYNQTRDLYDQSRLFRIALEAVKRLDRLIVRRSVDRIVTCSNHNSGLIEERYGRRAEVVNTCVDYSFYRREVEDAKNRLELGDTPLLLHVGSLIQRKNQLVSLQATRLLKRRLGPVRLAIVGDGPWKPILKRAISDLHLEGEVVFFGEVSEEELRYLYQACDVNLYPVREQSWGLVPFEAQAAGSPSVVSRSCGAAEVFRERGLGPVVEPSARELAKAAIYLLRNPDDVHAMVERGRRFIRENLTHEKYAHSMRKRIMNPKKI